MKNEMPLHPNLLSDLCGPAVSIVGKVTLPSPHLLRKHQPISFSYNPAYSDLFTVTGKQ